MSPLDMLIFLFFILVSYKAVTASIERWKEIDEDIEAVSAPRRSVKPAAAVRTAPVQKARPAAARITPIKRVKAPAAAVSHNSHHHLKDKGAA